MHIITGKTKLLGIIGDPVEHSLSPVMHNAAIRALGLDYVYIPLPVKSEALAGALAGFTAIDLMGFNVTIPHKQTIINFLTQVSELSQLVGATNTVWRTNIGWSGTNTDVDGFLAPLQQLKKRNWSNLRPLILGHGGAARAVVVGLTRLGCPEIRVVGRNIEKLEKFKASWAQVKLNSSIKVYNWLELPELLQETELLVNATPIGMYPQIEQSPLEQKLVKLIQPGAIAYDLIYTPKPTRWLQEMQAQGAIAIDGLEMLVQQGAIALEIWLQQSIPVEIMRQSLQDYLGLKQS